jgi:hypothetical protein
MCVVSMVMDHYLDKWRPPAPPYPMPTPAELEEFRRLLERAREYDRAHGQPDCGLEEKRRRVRELAESLGVKVDFV